LVIQAAKKTGDYASLSQTDMRLVALCVSLDMELTPGKEYIIRDPVEARAKQDKRCADASSTKHEEMPKEEDSSSKTGAKSELVEEGEWITPENIDAFSKIDKQENNDDHHDDSGLQGEKQQIGKKVKLACISGDCAVQNLLLSLNLKAYNIDMKRIRHIKSFLLRCHACGWCTMNTAGSKFCGDCGSPTLRRASYTINSNGQRTIWLRDDYVYNLRGTKYPLPTPKGGRQGDLVLRADQREYQRALARQKRQQEKLDKQRNDQDALDERLAAIFGDLRIGGKQSLQAGRAEIGFGRRNPNEPRRR
jgi:RNA-binding protein NOB1